MSLLWFHNPDYYATAHASRFWSTTSNAVVVAGGGYGGAAGMRGSALAAYAIQHVAGGDALNRFRVGCRFRATAYPASAQIVLAVVEEDDVVQCCVSLDPAGTLTIWRGPMTAALTTSVATVALSAWHRIGFKGTISKTIGEAEVHLNSTRAVPNRVVNAGGVDTSQSDHVAWSGAYVGLFTNMASSDYYAVDGEGSVNDLLPGLRVGYAFGSVAVLDEWTKNTGTLAAALDDAAPDDDATYIYADAYDLRYSLTPAAFPATETIYGVQSTAQVRNIAANGASPSHEPLVVVDGSEFYGPWQSCVQEAWRPIRKLWAANPLTGEPWTVDDANAAEWGGRVHA